IGDEVFADAFDRPTPGLHQFSKLNPFVENRAGRIGQDHLEFRLHFLEKTPEASERATGADPDNDGIDVVIHLLPDFWAGGGLMGERVRWVAELIDVERARNFIR